MPDIPGLRSCYSKVGRLVYFGRMLDKIRLHAAGKLPADYVSHLGDTGDPALFDARCCRFLGMPYGRLASRTLEGGADGEILAWAHEEGLARTDEECAIWNSFMMKRGWRDESRPALRARAVAGGLATRQLETWFDLLDWDEGRDPSAGRPWEQQPSLVIVLTGVAGSGKTTVGRALAAALGWNFRDADEFHPPANIARMSRGIPLTDEDRAPWLAAIRAHIAGCLARNEPAVTTCSALKESYRRELVIDPARVKLVYLTGAPALLRQRLGAREGHFMKPEMLASQLAALEPPADGLRLDVAEPPAALVARIRQAFQL